MITKQEVDNILQQVNAILAGLDKRLTALEESQKKGSTTKTSTSQTKSS